MAEMGEKQLELLFFFLFLLASRIRGHGEALNGEKGGKIAQQARQEKYLKAA